MRDFVGRGAGGPAAAAHGLCHDIGQHHLEHIVHRRHVPDVKRSILAACGVRVSLVISAAGAGAREGWRRFLHGTLRRVAAWSARSLSGSGCREGSASAPDGVRSTGRGQGVSAASGTAGWARQRRAPCGDSKPPVGQERSRDPGAVVSEWFLTPWAFSWAYSTCPHKNPSVYGVWSPPSCYRCRNAIGIRSRPKKAGIPRFHARRRALPAAGMLAEQVRQQLGRRPAPFVGDRDGGRARPRARPPPGWGSTRRVSRSRSRPLM